jgi:CheY-like chemotaxis protein
MATDNSELEGLRILVAEDEGLIALELETVLQGFGCEVVGPVSRVGDVLCEAERGGLDGALLDVNLRGEQIFAVLPQLIMLDLKIVITSGYDDATLFPPQFRSLPPSGQAVRRTGPARDVRGHLHQAPARLMELSDRLTRRDHVLIRTFPSTSTCG